jgi:hypothetical protein
MIRDIIQPLRTPLAIYFQSLDTRQAYEADQAIDLAQDTVMFGLRRQVMHGNNAGLASLFSGQANVPHHDLTGAITQEYAHRLTGELNVPGNVASMVAVHFIPAMLQAMVSHVTENGAFDSRRLGDLIAGDLGSLNGDLEKGLSAARGEKLGDQATGILGFGIGGKYDTDELGRMSDADNR